MNAWKKERTGVTGGKKGLCLVDGFFLGGGESRMLPTQPTRVGCEMEAQYECTSLSKLGPNRMFSQHLLTNFAPKSSGGGEDFSKLIWNLY